MKDWLEIKFWQFARWLIKRGYGADCETSDLDDFEEMYAQGVMKLSEKINHRARCGSCRAKEVIAWIDDHIDLLRFRP